MVSKKRLRILKDFLNELDDKNFNFGFYISKYDPEHSCNTVACAVGWCPTVFPKHWKVSINLYPVLVSMEKGLWAEIMLSAIKFFRLNKSQFNHLFVPGLQNHRYGGEFLDHNATPKQVASNIEAFLESTKS